MRFTDHFNKVIVINLRRRRDRLARFMDQMDHIGVSMAEVTVFEAYDKPLHEGLPNGNMGCTASHRAVLEIIAFNRWERVMVFEDDAMVRPEFINGFDGEFRAMFEAVPKDFAICYLGAHYADVPKRRVNDHVIEANRVLTTSSYIIGHKQARLMAPYISGVGPIDNLFSGFTERGNSYILEPRMFVQYTSESDLTGRIANYEPCMTDTSHVAAMDRQAASP